MRVIFEPAGLLRKVAILALMSTGLTWAATKEKTAQVPNTPAVVTGNARVDKLLSEMKFEEKVGMLHGEDEDPATFQGQAGYLQGVHPF